ncbi:DUF6514 family protein [Clostridium sp. 'White wine YQ']|uniref:DUF6514 family protein n=1 Tax=Clostridium sp. 'White wine YQ' TaxID=3027474 RepID=UPI002366D45F|nr:DUF6514 family protein [Clostridium sp. 'White wine YQ']MDD7795667.1 DUF6514 family protein [Clostridium sp. 'White wine YQ']
MVILKSEKAVEEVDLDIRYEYSYRLTENLYDNVKAYGIEAERLLFKAEELKDVERESINLISPIYSKVEEMLNLIYKHKVSPVHVIDILGEKVDECVLDF